MFLVILFVFLLNPSFVEAQKTQIEKLTQKNEKLRTNIETVKCVKDSEGNIYVISCSLNMLFSAKILIQKFEGENFKFLQERIIESVKGGYYELNDAYILDDKIVLLISGWKSGDAIVYSQKIDTSTLKVSKVDEISYFARTQDLSIGEIKNKYKGQTLQVRDSSYQSRALILPDIGIQKSDFRVILETKNKREYDNKIELPSMKHGMRVAGLFLDSETNNINSIIQTNSDKDRTEQYNYLITFDYRTKSLNYSKISNGTYRLVIVSIEKERGSKRIKATGFYANKGKEKKDKDILRGVFTLYLDDIENIKLMPSEDIDSKTNDLATFELKQRHFLENGDVIYVNEKKIETETGEGAGYVNGEYNHSTEQRFIHFEDLIVYKVDKEGSLIWSKYIPKTQHFSIGGYLYGSVISSVKNDKLYLYTTSSREFDKSEETKLILRENQRLQKAKIIEIIIDTENGSISSNTLLNGQTAEDLDIVFLPYFASRADENEVIMPCLQKNRRYTLIRIFLNK